MPSFCANVLANDRKFCFEPLLVSLDASGERDLTARANSQQPMTYDQALTWRRDLFWLCHIVRELHWCHGRFERCEAAVYRVPRR